MSKMNLSTMKICRLLKRKNITPLELWRIKSLTDHHIMRANNHFILIDHHIISLNNKKFKKMIIMKRLSQTSPIIMYHKNH